MNRWIPLLYRFLLGAAAVVLLFYMVVYVAYAFNLITFPFDYDQGEGFELVDVMMISEFHWPYQDIETYPFYGSIYPPVYHIFLVPFAWIFGPQYWYGRLFSFLTTLVTAGAISAIVWRENPRTSKTRWIALLAGLAFLASNIVYHIGPLFRQHISMVMFETIAVMLLAHANEIPDPKRLRRRLWLGLGLLIIGGYTKQLAAFTALPVLAFLMLRNPRRGLTWSVGFATVGVLIFAYLTIATNSHWWTQTITANVKDFDLSQAMGLLWLFVRLHWPLLIPAVLMVLHEIYFARLSVYSLWFVVNLGLNMYAAGTWGAGDSYYATAVAATAILSGIFAARTLNGDWQFYNNYLSRWIIDPWRRYSRIFATSALIVIPVLYLAYGYTVRHLPTEEPGFDVVADILNIEPNAINGFYDSAGRLVGGYANIGHFLTEEDKFAGEEIVAAIASIPEEVPVLSEEAAFSFKTDREVITNPVVLYILDQVGAYDSSELVSMIEDQEFGAIILRAQFFPVAVNQAITTYYTEVRTVVMNGFTYRILEPA